MNSTKHIDPEDLALFAMQLLTQEEASAVQTHLEHCTTCRQELAQIQGDLAVVAHTAEMHSPPAQARERLLTQLSRERRENKVRTMDRAPELSTRGQNVPSTASDLDRTLADRDLGRSDDRSRMMPVPAPTFGSNSRRLTEDDLPSSSFAGKILPWAGWAIAAGLALTAGELYHERSVLQAAVAADRSQVSRLTTDVEAAHRLMDTLTDPSAMRVTLTSAKQPPAPQGKATYVADKGSLVFIASNLEPLDPYKVYELWIIPADGRDPVPAGTFHPDSRGNASLIMPDLPKGIPAKAFGITVEDEGGSRTPTMPIILAGT